MNTSHVIPNAARVLKRVIPSAARNLQFLAACALPLAAQTDTTQSDSAKAAAIVARHVAAVGGEAAFRAITHVHIVTSMSMANSEGPRPRTHTYLKAPNLMYTKMDMPGIGPMELGFDGKTHWSVSIAGPQIHEDIPRQLTTGVNFFEPPLTNAKISYGGRRTIGGRTYDVVRAVYSDSFGATHYFDIETGLLGGMDPEPGPKPPPNRMTMTYEDYRRFGAILQATRVTTIAGTHEMILRTVSVSYKPFDAKIFDPPEEVRKLRDKPPQR